MVRVRAVHGCARPPNAEQCNLDIVYCILEESWQTVVLSNTGRPPPVYGTPVERGSRSCKNSTYVIKDHLLLLLLPSCYYCYIVDGFHTLIICNSCLL